MTIYNVISVTDNAICPPVTTLRATFYQSRHVLAYMDGLYQHAKEKKHLKTAYNKTDDDATLFIEAELASVRFYLEKRTA